MHFCKDTVINIVKWKQTIYRRTKYTSQAVIVIFYDILSVIFCFAVYNLFSFYDADGGVVTETRSSVILFRVIYLSQVKYVEYLK